MHYSQYTEKEVRPVMIRLAKLVHNAGVGKLTAVFTKYTSSKLLRVATSADMKSPLLQELVDSVDRT